MVNTALSKMIHIKIFADVLILSTVDLQPPPQPTMPYCNLDRTRTKYKNNDTDVTEEAQFPDTSL